MAEGSRLDLSLHQVGRIHVLKSTVRPAQHAHRFARVATDWSWWL